MRSITITQPDDWHLHVRDNEYLPDVVPHTAAMFSRAIIMPNLKPPVTSVEQALAYRKRILAARPENSTFDPLMVLYLTNNTSAEDIINAYNSEHVHAVKYYPAGATTNSDAGVTDIKNAYAALTKMEELGLPLLIHGEVTDPDIDVFDREQVFIDTVLQPLLKDFPLLKVVLEHITTKHAAEFVTQAGENIAATITAHHLLYNRNIMFKGGMNPHYYCLPILKRESHRQALITAATSGSNKFFLGTDSAPHAQDNKETSCGCAGIYSAHAAIELYAEVFNKADALDKLEGFASFYGADFYGLPRNTGTITLEKTDWQVPDSYTFAKQKLIPLRAGEMVHWKKV
ncbi:MAG: dihydroorotase [Gammaproteobacteria bacterium]|nr:MAG: dihydroorotase [Gammaproteobacteria bacterium]